MRVRWTTLAQRDVDSITTYLLERSLTGASRVLRAIYRRADRLGVEPYLGRTGLAPGTRERVVVGTRYIIVYIVEPDEVVIFRVLHGAQQWPPAEQE